MGIGKGAKKAAKAAQLEADQAKEEQLSQQKANERQVYQQNLAKKKSAFGVGSFGSSIGGGSSAGKSNTLGQ